MKLLQTLRRRKRRFVKSLVLGVAVSILVSIASYLGYLDSIEAKALDLLLRLRGQQRSPEIVLIKIDDQAFAKLGEKQPLPRDYIASLVDIAARSGARVVGIDIEFKVTKSLGEYVGWEVAEQIVHQDEDLQGKSCDVSVFFTDVRDYTTLCESASPDQIAALMREVFGVMGKVIANHNGHIFDFIGDAVLAVFGAPKTNPDHADAAVQSAIEVIAALDELNGR